MRSNLENAGISQFNASAVITVNSTALRLMTGRTPGSAMQTGQTWVLGASLAYDAPQPQNIFRSVRSCTCTSSPMTVSYAVAGVVVVIR